MTVKTLPPKNLPFHDLEDVYDLLAEAIDRAGPDHETLYLTKLALVLGHFLGDKARISEAIEIAGRDL